MSMARLGLARMEMQAKQRGTSPSPTARTFTFSRPDFRRRCTGGQEFWYDGKLYDWQSCAAQGCDSLRVTAWPDDPETKVLSGLQVFFRSDKSHDNLPGSNALSTAQLLSQPFLVGQLPPYPFGSAEAAAPRRLWAPLLPWSGISPDIFSPPPERRCA